AHAHWYPSDDALACLRPGGDRLQRLRPQAVSKHRPRGDPQRTPPEFVTVKGRIPRREHRRIVRRHHEADLDIWCEADRNPVAVARVVDRRHDLAHIGVLRRRTLSHLRANRWTEDADGGEGAGPGDLLDAFNRPLDRLDPGDQFSRDCAARHPPRAVFDQLEKHVLTDRPCLARADAREPGRIDELDAEAEVIDAEPDEPIVSLELALWCELDANQETDLLLDRAHVRLDELERVTTLEAAIQVDEGNARVLLGGGARFHDILDRLRA